MEAGYEAFDLKRMFIGDYSSLLLLEIVFRTTVMYVFALLAVRLLGKRGIGALSPFEWVVVIALGSAMGDPMFYPEVPLVHGMIVITVIVVLQRIVERMKQRHAGAERFMESAPSLIVEGGRIQEDVLRREELSVPELLMELRLGGITNVGQVRYAYLEPSGRVSIFKYEDSAFTPGQSTLVME